MYYVTIITYSELIITKVQTELHVDKMGWVYLNVKYQYSIGPLEVDYLYLRYSLQLTLFMLPFRNYLIRLRFNLK